MVQTYQNGGQLLSASMKDRGIPSILGMHWLPCRRGHRSVLGQHSSTSFHFRGNHVLQWQVRCHDLNFIDLSGRTDEKCSILVALLQVAKAQKSKYV